MKYKEYFGSVHYSDDDRVFQGKVENDCTRIPAACCGVSEHSNRYTHTSSF